MGRIAHVRSNQWQTIREKKLLLCQLEFNARPFATNQCIVTWIEYFSFDVCKSHV